MKGIKTGGRVAGTPNRRTLEAMEVFGEFEFCPLEKILAELNKPGLSEELVINTCMKLMEFKFPKRKAIEYSRDLTSIPEEELIGELRDYIVAYERSKGVANG